MKCRNCFVSNSSSSSFLVEFPGPVDPKVLAKFKGMSSYHGVKTMDDEIARIEEDMNWTIKCCKKQGKDPEEDEDVIRFRERIAECEENKDRRVRVRIEQSASEDVALVLELMQELGVIESFTDEDW